MRFEDRWNLCKANQPPEQNLSIHLLDLFLNVRKEITSKLSILYKEEDVLWAAKEVLIVQTNTGIALSFFNCMKQMYNKLIETFISKIKDAAIPCNFRQRCKYGDYVDYTDRMVRDWLLVGMHDESTRIRAIEQ